MTTPTTDSQVQDTIVEGRPALSIIRTYETCKGEYESTPVTFSDGVVGRKMTGRVLFAIEIPKGLKPFQHWGDDYASSIECYELPDGSVVINRNGLNCCGYQAEWGRERFANRTSFEAWKTEVRYVDREHRFPGVNPHRREWRQVVRSLGL